ncbi:uncharacterized protein LOC113333108 isoform X1 [Papaver somniferum]|uniref:uncharacterized protein LOC113333108 isoform X1 n=1 Tax=Papaver somniferum TaxID=3469 RepID=UPI000E6FDFC1|nr:uncharacterized protein LOC113333108 isoform X1 [Papaver somniferum]
MGYAFILYSVEQEAFMHISAGSDWASSALHAEAKSVLKALNWLEDNILSSVFIATDCKVFSDCINKKDAAVAWTAENTIEDIISILDTLPQARIKFINKDYNVAADSVAKEARIRRLQHFSKHMQQQIHKKGISISNNSRLKTHS